MVADEFGIRGRWRDGGEETTSHSPDGESDPEVEAIVACFGDNEARGKGGDGLGDDEGDEHYAGVDGRGSADHLIELRKLHVTH